MPSSSQVRIAVPPGRLRRACALGIRAIQRVHILIGQRRGWGNRIPRPVAEKPLQHNTQFRTTSQRARHRSPPWEMTCTRRKLAIGGDVKCGMLNDSRFTSFSGKYNDPSLFKYTQSATARRQQRVSPVSTWRTCIYGAHFVRSAPVSRRETHGSNWERGCGWGGSGFVRHRCLPLIHLRSTSPWRVERTELAFDALGIGGYSPIQYLGLLPVSAISSVPVDDPT